ncbi:DUF1158 domain-containing protein [Klebsiella aerogenes]
MKHPLETLLSAAGILLLALISCLLLPAPSLGLTLAQKLVTSFHLMDLNQLYTLIFCLWFLALGVVEYLVLRWIWHRWFSLAD